MDLLFVGFFIAIVLAIALYALAIPQGDKRWWMLAALTAALVIASKLIDAFWLRVILLDAGAFVAVALVWIKDTPEAKRAAVKYLQLLILAVVCIIVGLALCGPGAKPPAALMDKIAVALLVVGFALKLACVPFYFWLPDVAEHAAPMTTALIVSVVDIAAFTELVELRATSPWVFGEYAVLWIALALLSMFVGALLALAQNNLKRMLAFSTIDDMGYLLLGVVIGSALGVSGALIGALSHALFKVILFGAVGIAESALGRSVTLDMRGLAAKFPVAGAAFIIGALGMIGVPPTFGFIARWRLYLAGAEFGGVALVGAMMLATVLALLYYVRAIHRVWLGAPEKSEKPWEPRLASAVLIALVVVVIVLGLFPMLITGLEQSLIALK